MVDNRMAATLTTDKNG